MVNPTPTVPNDFTANITLNEAGLIYHGYIISDATAQRSFRFVKELNETTYTFQSFGESVTYTYTIMNSGCTCTINKHGLAAGLFASLIAAIKSTKACNGTSGTLYVNDYFQYLPAVPNNAFCIDGTTPKYIQSGDRTTTFTNFVAGRPSSFPLEPMQIWQRDCNSACLLWP
jgi:hypothetical protein